MEEDHGSQTGLFSTQSSSTRGADALHRNVVHLCVGPIIKGLTSGSTLGGTYYV